jgi:hypothetical protein
MTEAAQVDELQASINAEVEQAATEAPVEEVASEAPADPAPAQEESVETPAEPDGVQKRINKITADKYEEKRRADALAQELEALKAQQQATPQQPSAEPKLEDFEFDDAKYQAALIDHKINQRLSQQQAQQKQAQEQARKEELAKSFSAKVAAFTETAPDYQEVIANVPTLPGETLDAVMSLDNGAQVAYYLGKHLDVADEIATASPIQAAMRLGEIRAQLANTKSNIKPSAAPAPVETLSSGGGVDKDLGEMSMEEIYNL